MAEDQIIQSQPATSGEIFDALKGNTFKCGTQNNSDVSTMSGTDMMVPKFVEMNEFAGRSVSHHWIIL